MKNIEEFIVKVSEKDIDLLNKKIDLTRWPDEINHRWSHGTDLNFLNELTNYWRNEFNWRDHEKKINDIGSYRYTTKSGLKLHFLHSKSNNDNAIPLVMTHGWPGALGYDKYIVQGGDWGATISKWMAELYPDHCIGIHLNMVIAWPPADKDPLENTSQEEQKLMANYEKYKEQGVGYYEIQKTKPQTLGYGLNDSPVGLAAWIVEKFYGWFDGEENKLVVSNDEVLAIVSLYWFSESITSSTRLYKENGDLGFSFENIKQPMAGAVFERDLIAPPRAWAEEIYNVVQWNTHKGGHFAALEQPESLSKDIIEFVKKLKI